MKKILFLLVLAILPRITHAATVKMSLSEAIKNNTIVAEGINFAGGFRGKTTRLTLTNNTKSVVQIKVDAGVIFKPDDDSYQPMVLAGDEFVIVLPKAQAEVEVATFCGDAPRHCPRKELHYTFSRAGSDTLVKVLNFLKKNALLETFGQSCVWIITNNHSIGCVYSSNKLDEGAKVRDFLCSLTGRPKPEYYTETANAPAIPDQPAYVPKTMKIIANFEIILENPKTLTLGVFNDSNVMVQKVFENQTFGTAGHKSGHRFGVEFEAEGALQGKYYIRLKEGETVVKEQMVTVD